jgi:hypothetical protein
VTLGKMGVDSMIIKYLAGLESLEVVQRYTKSFTRHDAFEHYRCSPSPATA